MWFDKDGGHCFLNVSLWTYRWRRSALSFWKKTHLGTIINLEGELMQLSQEITWVVIMMVEEGHKESMRHVGAAIIHQQAWRPPEQGWLKINLDGAFLSAQSFGGVGVHHQG